jgi:hypothetical protein
VPEMRIEWKLVNYFLNDDVKVAPGEMVKFHDSQVKTGSESAVAAVVASLAAVA